MTDDPFKGAFRSAVEKQGLPPRAVDALVSEYVEARASGGRVNALSRLSRMRNKLSDEAYGIASSSIYAAIGGSK